MILTGYGLTSEYKGTKKIKIKNNCQSKKVKRVMKWQNIDFRFWVQHVISQREEKDRQITFYICTKYLERLIFFSTLEKIGKKTISIVSLFLTLTKKYIIKCYCTVVSLRDVFKVNSVILNVLFCFHSLEVNLTRTKLSSIVSAF